MVLIAGIMFMVSTVKGQQMQQTSIRRTSAFRLSAYQFAEPSLSDDSAKTKAYYLTRSEDQKTAAWVFLGGGTILCVIGGIVLGQHDYNPISGENSSSSTGAVLVGAGIGCMIISIPCFISSGKNARIAAGLSFKNQELIVPYSNNLSAVKQPGISINIPFWNKINP